MEAAWLAGKGAGVLVGVADTGCDFACPALRGRVAFRRAFGKGSPRHGTHICSAIALAAPECKLAVATGAMETPGALAAALLWLASLKPAVANLSLALREPDSRVARAVERLVATGALVLCAADPVFPWLASLPGVHAAADFECREFRAWFPGGPGIMRGASVACAIASAQAALALSAAPGLSPAAFLERADRAWKPDCSISLPGTAMRAVLRD